MLETKDIELGGKTYTLSKFPAWEGTVLMSKLPVSMLPKLGDFEVYKESLAEVLSYVSVPVKSGPPIKLISPELINNHVKDWETTLKLFKSMVEYNTSFLADGGLSGLLSGLTTNKLPELLAKTLQAFSQLSSSSDSQPSTN